MAQRSSTKAKESPDPDDERKPEDPTDITARSWKYVLRKVVREFGADACTDLAASLTYYFVLSLFPALVAIVSLLGLFGQTKDTVNLMLHIVSNLGSHQVVDAVRGPLESLAKSPAAGFGFVAGILGAVWSASGYVRAFGRAMNRIYTVDEGRPFLKLRVTTLPITVVTLVLIVIAALILVVSGPVAKSIGDALGVGETALFVWNIVKWPILVIVAILMVAILYYASPNLKQPKLRWMSMGAFLALALWAGASVLFGLYVANFSSYNKTYGSLGAIIVFLLWIWITNIALLFGAEFDAETERGRQLQAGIEAEEEIKLPPRETTASDKKAAKHDEDVALGRQIRKDHGQDPDNPDAPKAGIFHRLTHRK
ncbi:YihY/virulence factor BrkB family protein [Glaciihabitans sp. UYNi722]|uniref:YihY/virulence factor BrkB family protein n=1 Tax=Glaciihabitans sp. UYNi722 TaxID=3156344 RepID=UPI003393AC4F